MIEVRGLTVAFGTGGRHFVAVDRVGFSVPEGGVFGLVGESGSGKSTVLKALAGLVPFAGTVRLAGEEVGPRRSRAQRRLVQMIFQDPYGSLNPTHTVDDILSEPLRVRGERDTGRHVLEALEQVALETRHRFRFPHQLSGGQRQRVAIARALVAGPRILLLDEPTSALDVSVQAEILNLFKRLFREHALTAILVSHDLAVVAHMCDPIAVMNQGRIVETLPVAALRRGEATVPYTRALLDAAATLGETTRA